MLQVKLTKAVWANRLYNYGEKRKQCWLSDVGCLLPSVTCHSKSDACGLEMLLYLSLICEHVWCRELPLPAACVTERLLRGPVWQALQWCDKNLDACALSTMASLFGLGKGHVCWKMSFNISIQPVKPESSQKASMPQQKDGNHRKPFLHLQIHAFTLSSVIDVEQNRRNDLISSLSCNSRMQQFDPVFVMETGWHQNEEWIYSRLTAFMSLFAFI